MWTEVVIKHSPNLSTNPESFLDSVGCFLQCRKSLLSVGSMLRSGCSSSTAHAPCKRLGLGEEAAEEEGDDALPALFAVSEESEFNRLMREV